MKKNILKRVAVVLTACTLAMGTIMCTMTFLTPTVVHAEEEYLYYATLDISSKGWKSYNTGLNYNLSGGTAGKIYQGAKLAVISEKVNNSGYKVAYVYSEDLGRTCYVTAKYLKKVETPDVTESTTSKKVYYFVESEPFGELKTLTETLYASKIYKNVNSLSRTATNITIINVFSSIESLKDFFGTENLDRLEIATYVAAYNGNTEELAKRKKTFESMYKYLETVRNSLTDCRDTLCKAPYLIRYFNISNVIDVTNDCNKLIATIDKVLKDNRYDVQVTAGEKAAREIATGEIQKVVAASEEDFGGKPRYIYSGTPYNGTSYGREWCVDYVQYMLKKATNDYCKDDLCGTVDRIAMSVSDYGGTLYVTCNSSYKYEKTSARTSLKNDTYYRDKINMNFNYDSDFQVQPGDIIVYGLAPTYRFAHVGLCVEVYEDGTFRTIEGNTSWNTYSGQCLNEKTRSLSWSYTNTSSGKTNYIMGVLRPNYAGTITMDDVK